MIEKIILVLLVFLVVLIIRVDIKIHQLMNSELNLTISDTFMEKLSDSIIKGLKHD